MRKMVFSGNEYSKKRAQMSLAQLGDGGWKQLEQAPEGRVARNMMVGGGVQVELQKQGEEGTEKKVGCRGNEKEKNMEKQKVKKRCRGGGKLVFAFLFLNAI